MTNHCRQCCLEFRFAPGNAKHFTEGDVGTIDPNYFCKRGRAHADLLAEGAHFMRGRCLHRRQLADSLCLPFAFVW